MRLNARPFRRLSEKVKQLRKKHNLTQEELAARVGVSSAYIGFIEQGQRNPSMKTADKIGRALKTSLKDLL